MNAFHVFFSRLSDLDIRRLADVALVTLLIFVWSTPALYSEAQGLPMRIVREAQQQLRELGYDPGAADGTMGARTASALKKFQSDHGLPVTGALDEKTLSSLRSEHGVVKKNGLNSAAAVLGKSGPRNEENDWNEALRREDSQSFREFLQKYPDSSNVRIVDITIDANFTFFEYESGWSTKDRGEASEFSSAVNGAWGYAVASAEVSIYPLTIPRASALGLRQTDVSRDSKGRVTFAKPPASPIRAKVLCVKDGSRYRIVAVEQLEQ